MTEARELELLREGIQLFNRGEFFECHEVLEQVWLDAQENRKLFLQGLIQIAVGFHHLRHANAIGAGRLLSAGADKVRRNAAEQNWINSTALLQAVEPVLAALQAGNAKTDLPHPEIVFISPAE